MRKFILVDYYCVGKYIILIDEDDNRYKWTWTDVNGFYTLTNSYKSNCRECIPDKLPFYLEAINIGNHFPAFQSKIRLKEYLHYIIKFNKSQVLKHMP